MKKSWSSGPPSLCEQECIKYFREHPVFKRLLNGFREKYASYGSFSGTVILRNLKAADIEDLEGFFQKNFHGQKSISISAKRFEKALKDSRFGEIETKTVLELYFQEEMSGKKENRQKQAEQREQLFAEILMNYQGTPAETWVQEMQAMSKESAAYLLKKSHETEPEALRQALTLGAKVINSLPDPAAPEYLAVYAANLTGNPHFFDDGTPEGKFLYQLVEWVVRRQDIPVEKSEIFPALQKRKMYLAAGILRDDISNYAMLKGVGAKTRTGDIHAGMAGFFQEGEMVQVPLSVIAGWSAVTCPGDIIYIVENPSVFALLCRNSQNRYACMCMNGQPRLSSLLVLDLLARAGIKVCYGGDFDPEGLLIAQKIKRYYQGPFSYWHMSAADYQKSRSKERISTQRLKSLERITDAELVELAEAISSEGVAGYQENIWEWLSI